MITHQASTVDMPSNDTVQRLTADNERMRTTIARQQERLDRAKYHYRQLRDYSIPLSTLDRALTLLAATVHPDRWQGSLVAGECTKAVLTLRDRARKGAL
jgi:hypothetical protein